MECYAYWGKLHSSHAQSEWRLLQRMIHPGGGVLGGQKGQGSARVFDWALLLATEPAEGRSPGEVHLGVADTEIYRD
jgi:hypothetical protein